MPRRLRHDRFGEPQDVLYLQEFAPEVPAADEIVLRLEAAAVHIADVRSVQSRHLFGYDVPRTPGFEAVGRVLRAGAAVQGFRPGDRVLPPSGAGTFTEELRVPAVDCLPAPAGDPLQLALATVNGATAWVMLTDFAALGRGDWLIQNAANSNCGRFVIALARERGIRTLNVVRRRELAAELLAAGADAVIEDGDDLAARSLVATGGVRPRVAFDAVGGAATQRLADCLATGSRIVSYGAMSGEPCHLSFYTLFKQDLSLAGLNFKRQMQARSSDEQCAVGAALAERVGDGRLQAKIAAVYRLEQWREAFAHALRTGEDRDGKVVFDLR